MPFVNLKFHRRSIFLRIMFYNFIDQFPPFLSWIDVCAVFVRCLSLVLVVVRSAELRGNTELPWYLVWQLLNQCCQQLSLLTPPKTAVHSGLLPVIVCLHQLPLDSFHLKHTWSQNNSLIIYSHIPSCCWFHTSFCLVSNANTTANNPTESRKYCNIS